MGGNYYERDVQQADQDQAYSQQAELIFQQQQQRFQGQDKTVHKSLDPKKAQQQNLVCKHRHPIVFALDITGSMGDWPKIIYDKMPMFYGQIMMKGYLTDPSISMCGIGDATTKDSCLQVLDFCQGKQIDEQLAKLFIYASGGGNEHESYEVAGYFYDRCVDLPEAELPFMFITGDEMYFEKLYMSTIQNVIGRESVQNNLNSIEIWQSIRAKYNTFFLHKQYADKKKDVQIKEQWVKTLGADRVLDIQTPKACIDVILGLIAITSRKRTLQQYIQDMQERGQDQDRINEVKESLMPYVSQFSQNNVVVGGKYMQEHLHQIQIEEEQKQEQLVEKEYQMQQIREKLLPVLLKKNSADKGFLEKQQQNETIKKLFKNQIPKEFLCPITYEIFVDPVMTEDGVTYERSAIEQWLEDHTTSPLTNQELKSKNLIPNLSIKKLIAEMYQQSLAQEKNK